jgi:hypothetical protein
MSRDQNLMEVESEVEDVLARISFSCSREDQLLRLKQLDPKRT